MAVITIAREVGTGADKVALQVCETLGYQYCDKTLLEEVAREQGIAAGELVDYSADSYNMRGFIDALLKRSHIVATASVIGVSAAGQEEKETYAVDEEMAISFLSVAIRALQARDRVVVVGRGGQAILRGVPNVLHVRIGAPLGDRVQRAMQNQGITRASAISWLEERDAATAEYVMRFHNIRWDDPDHYHMLLNTSLLGLEGAAEQIVVAARRLESRQVG